jgi:hypothetical protein
MVGEFLGGFNKQQKVSHWGRNATNENMSKDKPIHEVRLGSIKAAIWKNATQSGVRYNVTFTRLYKDGNDWKSTDSFGRDDLLVLAKVADQSHSWIHEHGQDEREENGNRSTRK